MWTLAAAAVLVAALAWAQPSRVGCGPTWAACGPAIVGMPGGTVTTTTLPGTGAPSWVPSMLAVWMMEEGAGLAKVNAQGTTSRNLTEFNTTIPSDFTNKMQGAASVLMNTASLLGTTDAALVGMTAPFTCFQWARYNVNAGGYSFQSWTAGGAQGNGFWLTRHTGTFQVMYEVANGPTQTVVTAPAATPLNTWIHLAIRQESTSACTLFQNGASVIANAASCLFAPQSGTGGFYTSANAVNFSIGGNLDEVGCIGQSLSAASICRICSCGVAGEQCTCAGTAFATTGRNASTCGACTLPADCSAAAPS